MCALQIKLINQNQLNQDGDVDKHKVRSSLNEDVLLNKCLWTQITD